MLVSILITVLALGFMVCVHELGHMLAAKSFGVLVHEFSIGMGPRLFSVKKGETAYSLRLFPIGGFVQMEGEGEESESPRSFGRIVWWKRLIVLAAGAVINVLVGWIMFAILNCGTYIVPAVVEKIPEEYAAESVFQVGDEVIKINGGRVHTRSEVLMSLASAEEETVADVTVKRGGRRLTLRAPLHGESKLLGVMFSYVEKPGILKSLRFAVYDTVYVVKAVLAAVRDLITGRQSVSSLSGPVEIVAAVDDVAQSGSDMAGFAILGLFAMIAVNLGVFNLLPIPALDGGQILFVIIEKITRKKIKPEVMGAVNFVFFALLMLLAAYVTFGDIAGLIKR